MSFPQTIGLLTTYTYLFLFPMAIIEGPIITVIAGFLSSLGLLNITIVFGVVVAGDIVGDAICYAFGYYGREKFIARWGSFFGVTLERIQRLEEHFKKHGGKTLMVAKLTHGAGVPVLVAAGVAKVPFWKFIWYNFISTLPKHLLFLLIGFYFGRAYATINTYLDYTIFAVIISAVVSSYFYFHIQKTDKKYEAI